MSQSQEEHDLIWCGLTEQKWRLERRLYRLRFSVLNTGLGLFVGMAFATITLWLNDTRTMTVVIEAIVDAAFGITWLIAFRVYRRGQRVVRDIERLLS